MELQKLAELTGSELQGDPHCQIQNIASIEQADKTDISFIHSKKYLPYLSETKAAAVILPKSMSDNFSGNKLINDDPYLAYAKAVTALYPSDQSNGVIHPTAVIHKSVRLGENVSIAANVVIDEGCEIASDVIIGAASSIAKNCKIGEATELKSHVTLYHDTIIGGFCLIHSGAVLGADGFGFAPQKNGKWYKIPQIGNVILGDNVEIGANTCIDRAALGSTKIGNGVILDNLIQVGHNVSIGENTAIAGQTAIAGSTKIGKRCRIAGASAIVGHLEIADDVTITATTLVSHSIHQAGVYSSGMVVDDYQSWRKNTARFKKLDALFRRVIKLEKRQKKGI